MYGHAYGPYGGFGEADYFDDDDDQFQEWAEDGGGPKLPKMRGGYTFTEELGQGTSGKVYSATSQAGNLVAVKVVSLLKLRSLHRQPERVSRAKVAREISLQQSLSHRNVVRLADHFEIKDKSKLYLVLEHAGQPLQQFVPLPLEAARVACRQLLEGLDHVHSLGIVHRDIKPENLLVTCDPRESQATFSPNFLKISDFGEAQLAAEFDSSSAGTAMFLAPEIALAQQVPPHQAPLVDVWAAGLSIHFIVTSQLPFNAASLDELFTKVALSVPPPTNRNLAECGPGFMQMLQMMLRIRPAERSSAASTLRHHWLDQNQKQHRWRHPQPVPHSVRAMPQAGEAGVHRMVRATSCPEPYDPHAEPPAEPPLRQSLPEQWIPSPIPAGLAASVPQSVTVAVEAAPSYIGGFWYGTKPLPEADQELSTPSPAHTSWHELAPSPTNTSGGTDAVTQRPSWVPREWTKIPRQSLERLSRRGAGLPRVWSEPAQLHLLVGEQQLGAPVGAAGGGADQSTEQSAVCRQRGTSLVLQRQLSRTPPLTSLAASARELTDVSHSSEMLPQLHRDVQSVDRVCKFDASSIKSPRASDSVASVPSPIPEHTVAQ